jgi:FkbM family methyltransferase
MTKAITILYRLINNKMVEIFLAFFMRLLWRLIPGIFYFTWIISLNKYKGIKIAFRPFIFSDIAIVSTVFETDVRSVFQPKPNETVIDVGAHLGLYTLIAAKLVGQNGKVISIEPDDANLVVLRKNVAINNLNNTIVLPVALGDVSGLKKFYAGVMPSASSFYFTRWRALYKVRTVKKIITVTLDELLEKLGIKDVEWIKIDVEGAELDVLRGGESFLQNSKNLKILIRDYSGEAMKYLQKKGFQVKQLSYSYYFVFKKKNQLGVF